MYKLNLDPSGRILSAMPAGVPARGSVTVQELPAGNIYDYRYASGQYIYDPLPEQDVSEDVTPGETQEQENVWDDLAAAIREGVNSV